MEDMNWKVVSIIQKAMFGINSPWSVAILAILLSKNGVLLCKLYLGRHR